MRPTEHIRMTCSTRPGRGHRELLPLPVGVHVGAAFGFVYLDGTTERVLCEREGCERAMRPVRILDSHTGTRERARCGARCVNAMGPACDCRCRGANHGGG